MVIQVKAEYATLFEQLNLNYEEAFRQFLISNILTRLSEFQQRVQQWQNKYECDYDLFAYKTSIDETYVNQLNQQFTTADWEGDLFEWEVDVTELKRWQQHLQKLLTLS